MLYNHAYTIAFSIDTAHPADGVTDDELLEALYYRWKDLRDSNCHEIQEACGLPYDTEIVEDDDESA